MENFQNQIHQDLSQEVLPQREERLREKKNINVPNENSQGRLHREKKY